MRAGERLIVALDVESIDVATRLVAQLDNVSFFKVGWRLLMAGLRVDGLGKLLDDLSRDAKQVFIDLKVPDIGNTVASVVHDLRGSNVKFLTLHQETSAEHVRLAVEARGDSSTPKLLRVPFLSSQDAYDLADIDPVAAADNLSFDGWLLRRAKVALDAGCDGLIASGKAIKLFRDQWPNETGVVIVSPGIRPPGSSTDDHKRHTTPRQAIEWGADYLVVGRPIIHATDPRQAAQNIIEEIGEAVHPSGGLPGVVDSRGRA